MSTWDHQGRGNTNASKKRTVKVLVSVNLRISESLNEQILKQSENKDINRSEWIRNAIEESLKR